MNINDDKEINQHSPLVDNLIEQATYFLGIKNGEKAKVIKIPNLPNTIVVNPMGLDTVNQRPTLTIINSIKLEKVMREYMDTVNRSNILYTADKEDYDDYIFRVWPNAVNSDFDNPDKLYQRYISFIKDDTYMECDDNTILGNLEDGSCVYAQRFHEERFLETPYSMRFTFKKGDSTFYLPVIRYGIEDNDGKKTAYIYAVQRLKGHPKPDNYNEYQTEMDKMLRQINAGVKENREVSPSAIIALSLFLGMLHRKNITSIKVPDFLFVRWYAKFVNTKFSEEELDRIQYNLTNKFLTNFLRLKDSFENFTINYVPNEIDSFMYITTSIPCISNVPLLETTYELGLGEFEKSKCI